MELFIIFRLISILLGLAIGFFSLRIYQLTKGATKGWFYMALAGIFLCIWACAQSIIHIFFPEIRVLTILSSLICYSVISFAVPLGIIKLNKSFDISLPKIFNDKSIIIAYIGFWLVLLVYNLIMPFTDLLMELAGVAHLMMTIMFLIVLYPAYLLWKSTKVWVWMLILLFVVLGSVSIAMSAYKGGCCNDYPLESGDICDSLIMEDYSETIPLPCTASSVKLMSSFDLIIMTIAIILGVIAFYGMWRNLSAINSPK